jgi:hypothetical protein
MFYQADDDSLPIITDRFCQALELLSANALCEMFRTFQSRSYLFACSARYAWYAFQPGHQPVCQRHSRAIKVLGLASAFFLMTQVSQAKVLSEEVIRLVFMVFS